MAQAPVPVQSSSRQDDEEGDPDGATYQLEMMRCLREVNVDNNTVGWYNIRHSILSNSLCC